MNPSLVEQESIAVSNRQGSSPAGDSDVTNRIVQKLSDAAFERASSQRLPRATYRIQFNSHFKFGDARRLVQYLDDLGVSHIYASPYLKSALGSEHGYNVVDPTSLNPELGTVDDFQDFVMELRAHEMGHLLDFVPNHMGVGGNENGWWQDVLEFGPGSSYALFFDIDWSPLKPDLANKVLIPVLGEQYGRVLENQELTLRFEQGAFSLWYFANRFPITPCTYIVVLRHRIDELAQRLGDKSPQFLEYQSILTAVSHLPSLTETESERRIEGQREAEVIKRRLRELCEQSLEVAQFLDQNVAEFNGRPGDYRSFDLLDELLGQQAYRLACWRVAADEINYRRFFDINELAAVCMEHPDVFCRSHSLIFDLLERGQLDGLRIDHADGLYDPSDYLRSLQEQRFIQLCHEEVDQRMTSITGRGHSNWDAEQPDSIGLSCGTTGDMNWVELEPELRRHFRELLATEPLSPRVRPLYTVVEKILEGHERLPDDWPVHGSTGYDFLNDVNGIFVASQQAHAMSALYAKFTSQRSDFDELVYQAKRLIMKVSMSSELSALGHQLDRISEGRRLWRDYTLPGLTFVLREIVACFPVYRTYTTAERIWDRDRAYIEKAVARAKRRNPAVSQAEFDFVQDLLLLRGQEQASPRELELRRRFVGRFQQFTGPLIAKAVEDTADYRYHRLVSLNEVGGDPRHFGVNVPTFHQRNSERRTRHPEALLATSTHDTKRSEDVRARINVLSEIPGEWKARVFRWTRWNKRRKIKIDGELAPSRNDEYLLYQTLIGSWPLDHSQGRDNEYVARIQRFMFKAMREAKVHSSWVAPHEPYERAMCDFVAGLLSVEPASAFRVDFEPFAASISSCGLWNSLSQTLLKMTSPGIPDIYQGTEVWDFSLVDPDNRRPVNFELRQQLLNRILELDHAGKEDRSQLIRQYLDAPNDGAIKMLVIHEALRARRQYPSLFTTGSYLPLEVRGKGADHVCAFARVDGDAAAIVVVPRLIATLTTVIGEPPIGSTIWGDTVIAMPDTTKGRQFTDMLTRRQWTAEFELPLAEALREIPLALALSNGLSNTC